ncbi:type III-B CRISPR module RAMP protein Cmr6 [Limisphaera sp. 4302-co]|uniref:type III-B CRISPR module RAMP protein Cmr6 n=1 Tax=Limisphaera sp. 4302-co TaxID=3400417 RepID=UPI003C179223
MPALLPKDTRELLSRHSQLPDGRSVLFDRFAAPDAREEDRCQWFKRVADKTANSAKAKAWPEIISRLDSTPLFAQLRSRLMVNMAGGVMENAGLCLDRFGMPYIPGSAVKGCARRMATQQLLETEGAQAKADLLFRLALIFGWGDTDWKAGRKRKRHNGRQIETEPYSDFWWAMAQDSGDRSADAARHQLWQEVAVSVATRLLDRLNVRVRKHPNEPWNDLPNFAGTVSFLPAYPVDLDQTGKVQGLPLEVPRLGTLELDVVTCHHPEYYRGDRQVASDTEDPNPVVFPAVAPGHVFAFALAPLRGADNDLLTQARTWLAQGLETFGLGAKTNAGYGWFDCSDEIQTAVNDQLKKKAAAEEKRRREEEERQKAKAAEEERLRKKRELEAKLKDLTPEQQEDYKLDQMSEDQLKNHLLNYSKLSELQQAAVYRLLKDRRPDLWRNLRQLSETGKQKERKRWGPLVQDMFKRAKQNNEKMPK